MAIPSYDDYVKNPDSFKSDAEIPSYDDYISQQPKPSAARRYIGDPAVSALKGAVGLDEGIVGLADLATGGRAGKLVKDSGIDFQRAQQGLDELYSPEQRLANENVQQANGVLPTIGAIAKNPSVIPHQIIQSAPLMLGGQAIARGAMSLAPKLAPLAAGAIGEGVVTAGSNAEQVRQQSGNELISPMQSALAAGSGLVTGAITQGSGQLASKLGVGDVNTMLLGGNQQSATKGLTRRIAESGGLEAGQEFLQSGQEQAGTNLALNKPIGEGVGNAAALGAVTGFGMGIPAAIAQPSGPLSRASTVAPEAPVIEPMQPEATVEPPETAATTETPVSNPDANVEVNPTDVAPSTTVNNGNPPTPSGSKLYGTEEELAQAKQRAAIRTEELKKALQVKETSTPEDYQFIRDQILHGNNSFEGAVQNLNKRNAERLNTITPASPGADNQRPEPSTGEARTEIPRVEEGSEVTQGTPDQKLTGENNGQIAGTDQGATGTGIGTADVTNLNARLPEIDGADNGTAIPPIVNADGGANRNSDSSDGRGLPGVLPGGVNGTGGISDPTLGDNGAIDQNPVLRAGNKLPDELTSPVDTAQQPQGTQDEKAIKETPNAWQERLLDNGASENGASVLNEDKTGTNDTQKATNPTPQTESVQPVTGENPIGVDTTGQEEKAEPAVKSAKPYKLSTGKALFREAVADKLLSKLEKSKDTAGKYYKDEVSKGVFQLIPKSANSKPIEIDGIKPQEQDETTTIPKQPITQEAKQPDEQMAIPANNDEAIGQPGEAVYGKGEVQGESKEPDDVTEMEPNVDVKEAQQAEATPETETPEQKVAINENAKTKPVQPEPTTDTSRTPAADVDSAGGQEVLGEEVVTNDRNESRFSAGAVTKILNATSGRYKDVSLDTHDVIKDGDKFKIVKQSDKVGFIGDGMRGGETTLTKTGRRTSPFPYISQKEKVINIVKKSTIWLMENAFNEAIANKNENLARSFEYDLNKAKTNKPKINNTRLWEVIPRASKDLAEQYLFINKPDIDTKITNPLVSNSIAQIPEKQPEPELKQEVAVAQKVAESNEKPVESESKESDNSTLSIFTQLDEAWRIRSKAKREAPLKAAQERMNASPIAEKLNYINDNYLDIIGDLEEMGQSEINGKKTLNGFFTITNC